MVFRGTVIGALDVALRACSRQRRMEVLWSLVCESRGGLVPDVGCHGDRERRVAARAEPQAVIEKLAKYRRLRRSGLELAVHAPVPCVTDTMPILKESCVFLPPCGDSWEHEGLP